MGEILQGRVGPGLRGRAALQLTPYAGFAWGEGERWHADAGVAGYLLDAEALGRDAGNAEPSLACRYRDVPRARANAALDASGFGQVVATLDTGATSAVNDLLDLDATLGCHDSGGLAGHDVLFWSLDAAHRAGRYRALDARPHGARLVTTQAGAPAYDVFERLAGDLRVVMSVTLYF